MEIENPIPRIIKELREQGTSECELEELRAELTQMRAISLDHACKFCGRASDPLLVPPPPGMSNPCPERMVFCYRNGKPLGICDLCFSTGNYSGLTELEIKYFSESFDTPNA
jgi:hypothetical protein